MKDAGWARLGIPRKMKQPESSVKRMAPATSCAFRYGSISPGKTTRHLKSISIRERNRGFCVSGRPRPQTPSQAGKGIPSRNGKWLQHNEAAVVLEAAPLRHRE